ncbi:unnamed protein product [Euphydryas editha]|uniref:Uncharacterized protein n=1 Tax=Euphydryas editha TaxID=104508 RepID=A0AAU9V4L9_EUPED|nr:unnamed protein product [Euphydryas editha]
MNIRGSVLFRDHFTYVNLRAKNHFYLLIRSWLTQPTGGLGYTSGCAMGRSPPGCSPHSALSHQTSPVNPFTSHQIQGQLQSPLQSMQPMSMNSYNAINVPLDGSSSPGSAYAATGSFSPNRHHDIVTSSDAVSRFSFWPEGGSPSPNATGYVSTSSFSPRRHDAVTSSDAAGRFTFWPEVGVKEESSSSILSNATSYSKCFM